MKKSRRRKNMRAADRERIILEAAIRFFAKHGFSGQTRELAKGIGISHSALYRHFSSKEELIERVYQHVYLSRWNPDWPRLITDRSRSIEDRLILFYQQYIDAIFDHDWVRIFMFSGLRSFDIAKRYLSIIREKVVLPVCEEIRVEYNLHSKQDVPIGERERELVWGLHGRIFYLAVRKFVYGTPVPEDLSQTITDAVREFMHGAPHLFREIVITKGNEIKASSSRKPSRRLHNSDSANPDCQPGTRRH